MTRTAIYLVGQGSSRDPRLVELQYLRILRAVPQLREQHDLDILPEPYTDPLPGRASSFVQRPLYVMAPILDAIKEGFPALYRLCQDIEQKLIGTVLIDLAELPVIPTFLKANGAQVINCNDLHFDKKGHYLNVDEDSDLKDCIAFFPRFVGDLIQQFKGYAQERLRLRKQLDGIKESEMTMKEFEAATRELKKKQPKTSGETIPTCPEIYRELQELQQQLKRRELTT